MILNIQSSLVGVLLLSAAASAQPGIITGPIEHNGHRYYLLEWSSWTDAEAAAVEMGGHLATINDAAENDWVYATFATFGGETRQLLIGLNDIQTEGQFVWTSGEPVSYTNWADGEPNDFAGIEDYTEIYNGPPGRWNDLWNWREASPKYGVVELNGACGADCNASGSLDLFDFLCFVNLFNDGDDTADCDDNGALDLFDFLCFVNAFNQGC